MKKWIKELIQYAIILIVVVLIRTFIMTPIIVDGGSMEPTLYDGEMMILSKLAKIDREDIVVIENREGFIIKRIYGMPGDTIRCEDGILYINGEEYDDEFSSVTNDFDEVVVNDNEYYVLGDNREISKDSRTFGAVKEEEILGTTNFILYPFKKFGTVD